MDTVCRFNVPGSAGRAMPLLALATLLLAATAAHSQSSITVSPLSEQDCAALAKDVSDRTGVSVDSTIGSADAYMYTNLVGNACLLSGTATGVSKDLTQLSVVGEGYKGWTRVPAYDADGPGSTSVTFKRDKAWFGLSVGAEPPAGRCDDVMISDCKAPMEDWTWTVSGMAFTAPSTADRPSF
ncbi:hypothetical protein AB7M35_001668 [Amorphus suaedae]